MKQGFFLLTSYIGRLVLLYGLAVIFAIGALLYFRDTIAHLQIDSFAKPQVDREFERFSSLFAEEGLDPLIERLEEYQNQPDQGFRYALINRNKLISGNMNLFAPERIFVSPLPSRPQLPIPVLPQVESPPMRTIPSVRPLIRQEKIWEYHMGEPEIRILRRKDVRKSREKLDQLPKEEKRTPFDFQVFNFPAPEEELKYGLEGDHIREWPFSEPDDTGFIFDFVHSEDLLQENFQLIESLDLGSGLMLIAAFDTRAMQNPGIFLNQLLIGLCLLIIAGFITTTVIGWKIHRRLSGINQTAADILQHQDLSRRIPEGSGRSEFDQLSHNLNQMLAGIEDKLEDMRHLSNNIAHDLRTPLTLLRHRLENLGQTPEDKEQALRQMDRILDTFTAILRISNLESGTVSLDMENIELSHMLQDVCDLYLPLAEKKDQTLQHHQDHYLIHGDRNLLFQVFANLVDNAVKHTPKGGTIRLSAERKNQCLEIYVQDSGPGIPLDRQDQMLARFARLDQSRNTEGNGLGLSLVKAIMDAHKGEIHLSNRESGLCVVLRFPVPGGGSLA